MTNIILCGGSGTRLWPISRTLMPKQFVKLFDQKSLFQLTVERNSAVCESQFIVSNSEQYFLALDQLEELGQENNKYLLEPVGRNTAPAIALACMALDKDENNNTVNNKHISIDSKNNLIYGRDKYITTIDVEDLIIVDTGDALLVGKKGSSQKVKQVVSQLKETTQLHDIHLTGNRPWGTYTVLEDSNGYKIKRIEVRPGKRLSLQRHKYRNEHWVVVSGEATVTINDKIFILNENESTYIKAGDVHRLLNDTNELLVIIEAQVGSYTVEDDIERLEDDYKRD